MNLNPNLTRKHILIAVVALAVAFVSIRALGMKQLKENEQYMEWIYQCNREAARAGVYLDCRLLYAQMKEKEEFIRKHR